MRTIFKKQISVKPIKDYYLVDAYRCSKCNSLLHDGRKENYCAFCGQKIDWSEKTNSRK